SFAPFLFPNMHLMDGHWFHSPVRFDSPATGRSWSSSSRNPAIPQGERLLNRGFSAIRARASKAALVTGFLGAFSLRAQSRRLRAVRVRAGPSSTEYDVIVIGAGLGGLACAAALGKAGRKVLVLEAHSVCGGCAHSFTRKAPGGGEYVFDSGPSILTDMGKRNPLRLVLDYVEASEYLEWIHYDGWGMLTPEGPWRLEVGKDSFRDKVWGGSRGVRRGDRSLHGFLGHHYDLYCCLIGVTPTPSLTLSDASFYSLQVDFSLLRL
ncbi:unnamed protein product, partial [Durusdinium trenchii]